MATKAKMGRPRAVMAPGEIVQVWAKLSTGDDFYPLLLDEIRATGHDRSTVVRDALRYYLQHRAAQRARASASG